MWLEIEHLPSRFPTRSFDMLEVEGHNNSWVLFSRRRWEYLELYILIQEWPLPNKGSQPSSSTTNNGQKGRHLHPKPLISKHLSVTHLVDILDNAWSPPQRDYMLRTFQYVVTNDSFLIRECCTLHTRKALYISASHALRASIASRLVVLQNLTRSERPLASTMVFQ